MRVRSALACSFVVAACSAASGAGGVSVDSTGPSGISGPPDASAARIDVCPTEAPVAGATCDPTLAATCEYGSAASPDCDPIYECVTTVGSSTATWMRQMAGASDDGGACPACPASVDELPPDGACDSIGALCSYYEGTCGCVSAAGDAGDAGGVGASDGGMGTEHGAWRCAKPAAGCPAKRPRLGAACVRAMTCDYGSCLFGADLAFECASTPTSMGGSKAWIRAGAGGCP